jgi:hypothetical protein
VFFDTKPWRTLTEIEQCREEWRLYSEQSEKCLKTVQDVRDFIDCFEHRKALPKREGRNNPRKGNIPLKVFRIWFARAYSNGSYGLPPKSDAKRPSYTSLEKFFAKLGVKGMRAALSNYRSEEVDPPNLIPRTAKLEKVVEEVKKLFPDFQTDKVFRPHSVDEGADIGDDTEEFISTVVDLSSVSEPPNEIRPREKDITDIADSSLDEKFTAEQIRKFIQEDRS